MDYTNTAPVWIDAEHRQIEMTINGERVIINAVPGLIHYDGIVTSGVPIDEYVPPEPPPPTQEQEALFDHENRLRALEGQPPLPPPEGFARNHG
jgi:hypothetical protein